VSQSKNMDKIVIFDWGGIVVNLENNGLEHHKAIIRTMRRLGCSLNDEEILKISFNHVERGFKNVNIEKISDPADVAKWWELGKSKIQVSADYDTFSKTYEEEFLKALYYPDVVDFAHSLKSRCKIGILSNLTLFDKNVIDAHYHLADFDKVYLSYELGMRKPDREIYQYIENDLQLPPKNILFLDDLEENIAAAKSCGWQAFKITGNQLPKMKSIVEEFLKA